LANGGAKTISQIDPATNDVVASIPTQYYPYYVAFGRGFLWVSLGREPFRL
jgi:YVTN family beta-propeller protein